MKPTTEPRVFRSEPDSGRMKTGVTANAMPGLSIAIRPRHVARALALLVLVIVIVGVIANLIIYNVAPSPEHAIAKLMRRFDLGHEPSIPSWYSSIALLAASILLAVIAHAGKLAGSADRSRWMLLAIVFLLLAIDEAVMIHEMADAPMHEWLNTSGLLYFAWVIPYSIFIVALGIFLIPFMLRLERRTRFLFVVSGVMFVSGAIGIELIEGAIVDRLGVEGGFVSMRLTFAQAVEEALEMFAIVLFIYALLDYLRRHVGSLTIECPRPSFHRDDEPVRPGKLTTVKEKQKF